MSCITVTVQPYYPISENSPDGQDDASIFATETLFRSRVYPVTILYWGEWPVPASLCCTGYYRSTKSICCEYLKRAFPRVLVVEQEMTVPSLSPFRTHLEREIWAATRLCKFPAGRPMPDQIPTSRHGLALTGIRKHPCRDCPSTSSGGVWCPLHPARQRQVR